MLFTFGNAEMMGKALLGFGIAVLWGGVAAAAFRGARCVRETGSSVNL